MFFNSFAGNTREFMGFPKKEQYSKLQDRAEDVSFEDVKESPFERNSSQPVTGNHFPDVRNMVNTRLHIAAMAMQGILANNEISGFDNIQDHVHKSFVTQYALEYADALIAECEKGGDNE